MERYRETIKIGESTGENPRAINFLKKQLEKYDKKLTKY
jgi:hypothetical protein